MEHSPSREAANCAASQLPSILQDPNLNYCAVKSPQIVTVLNQTNPVHSNLSYLSKIQLSVIHPLTSWST
jgi:hypothetical protein